MKPSLLSSILRLIRPKKKLSSPTILPILLQKKILKVSIDSLLRRKRVIIGFARDLFLSRCISWREEALGSIIELILENREKSSECN